VLKLARKSAAAAAAAAALAQAPTPPHLRVFLLTFAMTMLIHSARSYSLSNAIDIYWWSNGQWTLANTATQLKLSQPRNWMSATTFCTVAYAP
jgi:hypothetical protein